MVHHNRIGARSRILTSLIAGVLLVCGPTLARAEPQDSAAVATAIDRFHRALAEGDSATVAQMLLPDVVILESGSVESRDEYLGGHLRADMSFAGAVVRERGPIDVRIHGDVAFATSTSTSRGEVRGRAVNSAGAELMVLRRTPDGWRLAAIHWSSRSLRS